MFVIHHLQKMTPSAFWAPDTHFPNYTSNYPLAAIPPTQYPEWMWDKPNRTLMPTPETVITDELRARSILATEKRNALVHITLSISNMRLNTGDGIRGQDIVYMEKRAEAERFLKDSEARGQYPFVQQHAQLTSLGMEQAARDILFAAQRARETLLHTEGLRLTYFELLRNAKTVTEIHDAIRRFREDTSIDALR